ncbi:MAG: toll/interleukin-1 receptor domain-containing protein [Pseudomonadota bacterium]
MRVFLSYSRQNRQLVERVQAALTAAGFNTFLDTEKLPIGQEYNARIKRAVDGSDLFVFFASSHSIEPGSYAMTELTFAESKWRNPAGYVLPIAVDGFDANDLPAYLKPITAVFDEGGIEARIVGWVEQRSKGVDPDGPDEHSPQARLARWARLAQPPVAGRQRAFVGRGIFGAIVGTFFIGFGTVWFAVASESPGPSFAPIGLIFAAVGVGAIVYCIRMLAQGLIGSRKPIAVVVLDRETGENSISIKLETLEGKRLSLTPIRSGARGAHTGDIGWAYIRGKLLIEFFAA